MNAKAGKQRVVVYIGGYNLYYGLRQAFAGRYKWLNLQGLAESFLRPDMQLVKVKYFTAITKASGAKQRQEVYLKALQAHCDKLEVFYGRLLSKNKICRNCGDQYPSYEEKKTGVNIACQILNDAHLNLYDRCYLVSGDSDLVPPLQIIKDIYPGKHSIVAHPPKRKSMELSAIANGWFAISEQKLKLNQLPEKLITVHGNELTRPKEWN